MSINLLDAVKGYFDSELINKAAGYLGETESALKLSLHAIIPVSLAGIIERAESSPESVLGIARQAAGSGILANLSDSFKAGGPGVPSIGTSLIEKIFGNKFGSVANAISGFSGIKGATASSLFGTIVPLALGIVGKHVNDNNLSSSGLTSLLNSEKNSILSTIPSGLDISKLLGAVEIPKMFSSATVDVKRRNWLTPVLILLLTLLLFWFFMKKCNNTAVPTAQVNDTTLTFKVDTSIITGRESLKIKLPNGIELDAYKGGIEEQLVAFLMDANAKPGKDVWFDFHDLNFKFATAEIVSGSRKEIDNIVKILQAFPSVKIKIGGYTDKVGNETTNMKLSQDRASAVLDALKTAGVGSQVTGAEGYGSQFAKYAVNAPETDRVKDRHVSVSVREK